MTGSDEIAILLSSRAGVYRILQDLLGNEPNREIFSQLAGQIGHEVLSLFITEEGEYEQAVEGVFSIIQERQNDESAFLEELHSNFTRLFVGPGAVQAGPWESLYVNKEKALFRPSTLEVRKAYVAQGFIPQRYPHIADDHIALELDFMAKLAEKAELAFAEGNNRQVIEYLAASREFLDQHLLLWVPSFTKVLCESEDSYFYCQVGILLKEFLLIDENAITEMLDALT